MIAAIVTACYVLGFVAALDAIIASRTAQGALAWAASLVSFPFIALPAYLVFGRSKFAGSVQAYNQRRDEIDSLIDEVRRSLEPWTVQVEDRPSVYAAVKKLARMQLTHSNSAELLIDGEATFDSIIAGIASARAYVLFQFYIVRDDGLGRRIRDALVERARAGVRVYFLYDDVGSARLPTTYLRSLEEAGVAVSSFKPNQGFRNRFQLNFRNHRKIVVVDGVTAWVGGHNVGDEYLGLDTALSPWRDTHVKLQGPVATQLQTVFLSDWYWATRELPALDWAPVAAADGDIRAIIVPSAPTQRLETAGLLFVSALHSARTRIWLSAPYFVPDEAVMKALELAALRGVDVRVITTGTSDSFPVYMAAFHYIEQLRDLGIRFYAFDPGFLHEKVALVDDDVAAVGTANFDNRSFRLNFEVTAVIVDRAFADQMQAMFEADFARSRIIDPAALDAKPLWWRLAVKASRLAAPVL